MIQLIVSDLKLHKDKVLEFTSKDKCEEFLDKSCCPKFEVKPNKGIKYRVLGATYDSKSEEAIIKPYLFEKKNDTEDL